MDFLVHFIFIDNYIIIINISDGNYMTLEEKLEKSRVVKSKIKRLKSLGIQSKRQRILSIIIFVFMTLYIVYSKIILNTTGFDWLILFIVLNLITLFFLKLLDKSVVALNHIYLYKTIVFINKVCKVGVFAYTMIVYYNFFNDFFLDKFNVTLFDYIGGAFNNRYDWKILWSYSLSLTIKFISMLVTIVLFISTFFYFVVISIKYFFKAYLFYLGSILALVPIIGQIFYFWWLFKNSKRFDYYILSESGKSVTIETREINSKKYYIEKVLIKLSITLCIICATGLGIYFIFIKK